MLEDLDDDNDSTHAAEQIAHRRFGVEHIWRQQDFEGMFSAALSPGLMRFIEAQPFFFIATSNTRGACDCSFRGREHDASGQPYALLKALDARTLVFPDYSGNNFFNSLGNILATGQIGMLFIDFEKRRRARINGLARIVENRHDHSALWPLAQRYVEVTVEQVFGNCSARIPRMQIVAPTDSTFQDE